MRRWVFIGFAVLTLLAVTDVLAWQTLTMRMQASWQGYVAQRRAEGWRVAAGEPVKEGFPLAARLRIADVEFAHDSLPIPGGMSFGAETLVLEVPFIAPTHLLIKPQQAMHLRVGVGPDVDFTATDLTMRGAFAGREADISGTGLQIASPLGPIGVAQITAQVNGQLHPTPPDGTLVMAADGIDVPPNSKAALIGARVDHADLDVAVSNNVVTVRGLTLAWGQLGLTGQGTLRADALGQPSGDAKLRLSGALETIDSLTKAGQIAPRDAQTAKTVLAFLQHPGPDGKPAVEMPLKLHDRVLTVGGFPLIRLPELHLPYGAGATTAPQTAQ